MFYFLYHPIFSSIFSNDGLEGKEAKKANPSKHTQKKYEKNASHIILVPFFPMTTLSPQGV